MCCNACLDDEMLAPNYAAAREAERRAVLAGDYNYSHGLTAADRAFLAARRAARRGPGGPDAGASEGKGSVAPPRTAIYPLLDPHTSPLTRGRVPPRGDEPSVFSKAIFRCAAHDADRRRRTQRRTRTAQT